MASLTVNRSNGWKSADRVRNAHLKRLADAAELIATALEKRAEPVVHVHVSASPVATSSSEPDLSADVAGDES